MRHQRDQKAWIERQAEILIRDLENGAYAVTRRMMRSANDLSEIRYWSSVKEVVAIRVCFGEVSD